MGFQQHVPFRTQNETYAHINIYKFLTIRVINIGVKNPPAHGIWLAVDKCILKRQCKPKNPSKCPVLIFFNYFLITHFFNYFNKKPFFGLCAVCRINRYFSFLFCFFIVFIIETLPFPINMHCIPNSLETPWNV